MNIEPNFADHWKTQKLVSICGEAAVLCLLRIWALCQTRKTYALKNFTPEKLERACKWAGEPRVLFDALMEVEFIERRGRDIIMHDFNAHNSRLCSSWENGAKGGRPKAPQREELKTPQGGVKVDIHSQHSENQEVKNNPTITQIEFGFFKEKREQEKKKNPPTPPYKEKKNEREKEPPVSAPRDGECVKFFSVELKKSGVVGDADSERLTSEFADFARYRLKVCRKPIKPETGARHARRVIKRLMRDGLSVDDVIAMFEAAMDSDWQGWDFDSLAVKLSANRWGKKNKNAPRADLEDLMGSFGVPAGAFEGGAA